MLNSLVYVQYGKCPNMPALTGVGRIVEEREAWGETWVLVEPVEDMPLSKWVRFNEVQYAQAAQAAVA